jgi:hypothetical protein
MSDSHRLLSGDFELIESVTEIKYLGETIPLQPKQLQVLSRLLAGCHLSGQDLGVSSNTLSVHISTLREVLRDLGIPIIIKNTNGNIGRPGSINPLETGKYYIVTPGLECQGEGDKDGRSNASSRRACGLQGRPGRT